MTDYQHLRELAQAATGGEWQVSKTGADDDYRAVIAVWDEDEIHITDDGVPDYDAEFIAAANPAVVLDLLDRIATLTTQVSNQAAELEDTRAAALLTQRQLDAHRAGQGTYEGITR